MQRSSGHCQEKESLNVKHNEFKHVKDLEKGWKCTVTEKNSLNQIGRKLTVSWVLFDKNKEVKSFGSESHVDFEIDEKFNEAVHIVVTNKFKENTGGFTLEKKVKYEDDEDEDELEGKEFTFEWQCTTDRKEVVKGSTKLKDKEEKLIQDLPLDSSCEVSEKDADVAGYKHTLQWLANKEELPAGNTITVTPRELGTDTPLTITAVNSYTPIVVPPLPPITESTTTPPTTKPTTTPPTTSSPSPKLPPIPFPIPIPIPIPLPPGPAAPPAPPAPPARPAPPVTNPQVAPATTPQSTATPKPNKNTGKGVLARTGASVIWMIVAAILLAGVGSIITYYGIIKKKRQ